MLCVVGLGACDPPEHCESGLRRHPDVPRVLGARPGLDAGGGRDAPDTRRHRRRRTGRQAAVP